MIYFQSLTKSELIDLLRPLSRDFRVKPGTSEEAVAEKAEKRARYRAAQIFHWVYQRFVTDWDQMTDLSKELRVSLKEQVGFFGLGERISRQALDGTHKFLWELPDRKTIESVIIPAALQEKTLEQETESAAENEDAGGDFSAESLYSANATEGAPEGTQEGTREGMMFSGRPTSEPIQSRSWARLTACISSQVGCAMGCKFCLTGIQGLDRQLETHEIVAQIFELRRRAPITNIVFMGMGEPLHNVKNVIKACDIFLDQDGLNFSKRKVTVSTSGLVPAIEELGKSVDVSLAISLNATTDEQRSEIMPVNRKWNMEKLLEACRHYPLGSHRRITFEYVMLKDFNDSLEDAARLVKLVRGVPSKINLIPFNEHSGAGFRRPSDETVRAFQKYLSDRGLTTTVRVSRGREILAACGQLRSIFGTARGSEKHKDWKILPVVESESGATKKPG